MLENNNNKERPEKKEAKVEIHSFKKVSKFSVFVYKRFKLIIFFEVLLVLSMGYLFIIRTELLGIEDYNKLVLWKQEELEKIKDYKDDSLELEKQYKIIEKEVESSKNRVFINVERQYPVWLEWLLSRLGFI